MDKIEKNGPGCFVWMRLYNDEDELLDFLASCDKIFITQYHFRGVTIKELEQDATQESSQGCNEETEAEET